MNILKITLTLILVGGMLVGCHTMYGAGQDVSYTGHAISRAATTP